MKASIPWVYIPFEDGSSVSFDGKKFTIHRQPVEIDADLSALPEGKATRAWRERRGDLVKALESAWWRLQKQSKEEGTKRIYTQSKSEA